MPADGYTLLVVNPSYIINPTLYDKVPYDVQRDFDPVTLAVATTLVLTVHPTVPARTVKELVALIKASPGKYSYASPGTGTPGHLVGETFRLSLGLDLVHVPFNGAGPAITSTIAGHTPIAFTALPPAVAHAQSGKLRALAVMSAKRAVALPDVPTIAEAGVSDQEADTLTGLLAPAGTPEEIVDLLQRQVARIVALPDVKERLTALGFEPVADTPEQFGALIKVEMAKWGKVVREANIRIE
jgi:tripartite-type tricarboxylate transporter receptor subunit TctC